MSVRAFGPGRVNLIGEHTDYNDGLAMPFAIERGVTVTAEPARMFTVDALDLGERDEFDAPERAEGWRAFARGMVGELRAAGFDVAPAHLTISGDVPQGSGLSSSAALEAALALALLGREPDDLLELAQLCSRVENDWVGAETGLLDQLASLCSRDGHVLRIDFRSLDVDPHPLDLGEWQLVTVDSGATHTHAAGGYNERRAECRAACEALGITSLRDARDFEGLDDTLRRRVAHVVSENERVEAAALALDAGDLEGLGHLLDESHASLRDNYEASVPEVEATVERLKAAGAAGARMVGGGFGGSVLALLGPGVPRPAGAFAVAPGAAARLL
ncbi:galactokinase [Solirubrobacter sp. CPCC 204708]|uniref:Galactokinase n=1 Tax=Solirubrobacter deserti TaxID=2282478 RepID=A0ABT4RR47_9ACTN|nr:galactokinase [Solirubrobacter deserti]MBE2314740.1 galactokinase [Solirubrobacter deserti]MDA0141057.1 galactokinase [Solirubrobacter deserti]